MTIKEEMDLSYLRVVEGYDQRIYPIIFQENKQEGLNILDYMVNFILEMLTFHLTKLS